MPEKEMKMTDEERELRAQALKKIAQDAGWNNWHQYVKAVLNGLVQIQAKPNK